jgi:hypothetical protein
MGDITGETKRTLRRPKPLAEHVPFTVPALVAEWLWHRANDIITDRAKTKVKTSSKIEALFRGRVFCPRCGRRMTIRRDSQYHKYPNLVYYICTSGCEPWNANRCGVRYIPLRWVDDLGWNSIASLLKHPALVLAQQHQVAQQDVELGKQLELFEWQIREAKRRIARVQQDWERESSIYTADEAHAHISQERQKIARAEAEKAKLETSLKRLKEDATHSERIRQALEEIRDANLNQATFEEKRRVAELLDVKVYPWEDLAGAQLTCAIRLEPVSHQSISMASPKL